MIQQSKSKNVTGLSDRLKSETSPKSRLTTEKFAGIKAFSKWCNATAILVAGLVLFPLCLQAQNGEMSTLFGGNKKDTRLGWYVAFEPKVSQLENNFGGVLLGGKGGLIVNETYSFGLAGYSLLKTNTLKGNPIPNVPNNEKLWWSGNYGGFIFEYITSPNKLVHFTPNLLVGAAYMACEPKEDIRVDGKEWRYPEFYSFILEPGVGVELNVSKSFRMNLGVSYRYAPTFKFKYEGEEIASKTAFDGLSVNLAFKFGRF